MDLTISSQEGKNVLVRDYRKGNWTIQETMVLIEAKKMDDERRLKRSGADQRGKQAELRWKWVEEYCWKNGCFRSQNQCNDKWDNLMRDFKKVREHERKVAAEDGGGDKSYWKIEKNERRENNLPSNLLLEVYEALVEVVDRKDQTAASSSAHMPYAVVSNSSPLALGQHPVASPVQQQAAPTVLLPLSPSPEPTTFPFSQPLPTVDCFLGLSYKISPQPTAKRRKKREGGGGGSGGEGTSGAAASGGALGEIGSAISKSASIMAKAIESREEAEGRRHEEVLSLHERRVEIEESKAEIKRQGVNNLVGAINKLADSILALAAIRNQESFK